MFCDYFWASRPSTLPRSLSHVIQIVFESITESGDGDFSHHGALWRQQTDIRGIDTQPGRYSIKYVLSSSSILASFPHFVYELSHNGYLKAPSYRLA